MLFRLCLISGLFCTSICHAQMLADSLASAGSYEVSLGLTETEYEYSDSNFDVESERSTLSLGWHSSDDLPAQFFAQGGFTYDAELGAYEGNGFNLGGGVKSHIGENEGVQFGFYALLNYLKDSYEFRNDDRDLSLLELHLATSARYQLNKKLEGYAVLEIIPYSEGEVELSSGLESDIERDTLLNLKLGARLRLGKGMIFRPEIGLIGESSLVLGISFI